MARNGEQGSLVSIYAQTAPFVFVLLWSSSFIAAKVGLRQLSPLAFVAIRLSACAAILTAVMAVGRVSWAPLRGGRWLHCAIAGALINAVGLMAPHVGLTLVAAAPIALVQSLTPLLTAALGVFVLRERLRSGQWLGMGLGVVGVALVVGLAAARSVARLDGLALAFVGVLGLVAGTLWFGRFCRGVPLLPSATVQFLSAAAVSVAGAAWLETPRLDWTPGAVAATVWNTLAVSLGGMAIYVFMLRKGAAARVTANFYLVPGTTAIITWLLLDERLSPLAIAGFVVAAIGCWLVSRRQATVTSPSPPVAAR
jgi:drug/metabolite transporter (DMT)-like permease